MFALRRNWWAIGLRGVLALIFGLIALFYPGIALGALILVFGAYALLDGVFAVVAAIRAAERHREWWPLALEGVLGVVAGIVAFVWPGLTALALLYLIGAWALITGVFELIAAYLLHRGDEESWPLLVAGIASVIFGLYLIAFPGIGALSVVGLIGVYAVIFGALLIGLAWRLHEGYRSL